MKTMKGILLMTAVVALVAFGCSSRESEKKIAQLESRLQELEGKKAAAGVTPGVQTTPETQPADVKPEGPLPALEFETVDHDFGTIKEGDVVEYTYTFKNTGEVPLIIQGAQGSCGCTVPEWSKEPIQVGASGFVKAKFDSQGKPNTQNKTVTVTANTWPKQTVLRFKAMVLPKAAAPDNGPVKK
jgi:hypothetical protein